MNKGRNSSLNRSRIARAVFSAAESMGISNRERIEQLVIELIERLEKPVTLPGMEHLVIKARPVERSVSESEIEAMVRDALAAEESQSIPPEEKKASEEKPVREKETLPREEIRMTTRSSMKSGELKLSDNAITVLERRYLKKDKQGKVIEKPEDMFRRVARTIAAAEQIYNENADVRAIEEDFFALMTGLEFLPNSPTLMNAGRELGQLSACFVLPIEDNMESIFSAVKHTALIHKSGGGTGFSFSRLRPEKDRVGTTGGVASGPVSFMRAFDVATDVIKQGGTRRGANMAILSIDHPDIEKFITAKEQAGVLTNFNLSVAVTDKFMEAVKNGGEYELINPHSGEAVRKLNAKAVFGKTVSLAWKTGDPGVVFIDKINTANTTPQLGRIESTNPCGEQPLLPYESCNLGSINLSRMVKEEGSAIDYEKLKRTVRLAVRFLDNVIDVNKFPIQEIADMTYRTRKIGLGVMGFADMLLGLGIPYNCDEALKTAEEVMHFVNEEAHRASTELAAIRGHFPAHEGSRYDKDGVDIRNASCTTIAPTGTLSLIAGCSSGIEPLFALSYTRNILDGTRMVEVNPYFEKVAREGGFYSEEMMKELAGGAALHSFKDVSEEVIGLFITAHQITPEWHVKMQAAFQKYTDNAVSKTVNFAREATEEDVTKVYQMAFDEDLKGITIYRDGSKEDQPLSIGKTAVKPEETKSQASARAPRKRAKVTNGVTERVNTGCGYIYVTVNSDERGICEVFSSLGKAGGCATAQLEAACRLISLALRSGIEAAALIRQLKGIRCPSIAWEEGKAVLSCADAISSVLEKHISGDNGGSGNGGNGEKSSMGAITDYGIARNIAGQCPDCSSTLVYQEGCFICPGCGYTKC